MVTKLKKRRRLNRPRGKRKYKNLFVIATEGTKTEIQYFQMLENLTGTVVKVRTLKSTFDTNPEAVLKRMKDHLKSDLGSLNKNDQAWLVVDKDNWPETTLKVLCDWSKKNEKYGFALSNPKFEYWLLLHFEDAKQANSSKKCSELLKKYLPNYEKSINANQLKSKLGDKIKQAIKRAKQKDTPPCKRWPTGMGTTVYRLVEEIFKASLIASKPDVRTKTGSRSEFGKT